MALKVGNDMKLYYNNGTDASPVWVVVPIVGDVTVPHAISNAEVDLRISDWITGLPAKHSGSIDFFLANDIGGGVWGVLNTMAFARSIKQFASANAAIATSGTQYFKSYCHFTNFPWSQPTQEISSHDASLALSHYEHSGNYITPSWNTTP